MLFFIVMSNAYFKELVKALNDALLKYTHNESFLGVKIKWYILTVKGYLGEATER